MSTTTTRLGLTKPAGGSTGVIPGDDIVDVDVLNANFDAIDAAVGVDIVTSGTHPASPFQGLIIVESDTGKLLYWNGTTYVNASPGVVPAGTAAQRDTYWGVPATATARVALSVLGARWFNTDNGIMQTYYAQTGDAGALPYLVRQVGGWYGTANGGSRIQVVPKSVAGTGMSINAFGTVVMAAATGSIQMDQLFSPEYDDYEFEWDVDTSTSAFAVAAQIRTGVSGSEATDASAHYRWARAVNLLGAASVAVTSGGAAGVSQTTYNFANLNGAGGDSIRGTIMQPNIAAHETRIFLTDVNSAGRDDRMAWVDNAAGALTGLSMSLSAATTGKFRLYGLPKGY